MISNESNEKPINIQDPTFVNVKSEPDIEKEVCKICKMQFNSANDLTVHYNDVHEGPTNFQCQTCGKNFTNNRNLMKHIKRIHDPLKEEKIKVKKDIRCDICNKSFSENRDLNRHKMSPCYIKSLGLIYLKV